MIGAPREAGLIGELLGEQDRKGSDHSRGLSVIPIAPSVLKALAAEL